MKTTPLHQSLETPTETDTQGTAHVYQKPVRDVNELKQYLIETWSAGSKATLIKRLIVLMHVSTSKANTLNICSGVFFRNCRDFEGVHL